MARVAGRVDNDFFDFWEAVDDRPDRDYTHGTSLTVELAHPSFLTRLVGSRAPSCRPGGRERCARAEIEIGQRIFTPAVDGETPVPGERPFAGWLYGRLGDVVGDSVQAHRFGVTFGWTGEPSGAEAVQTSFHELIHRHVPVGWDSQIPFEPGIALDYEYRRLLADVVAGETRLFTLAPRAGAVLGTVRTGIRLGATAALGWNAPHPWDRGGPRGAVSLYGAAGVEGEWVARDLFLDGSTFDDSPRVDRRPFVSRRRARLALRVGPVEVGYEVTASSRTYRTQEEPHTYGSLTADVLLSP